MSLGSIRLRLVSEIAIKCSTKITVLSVLPDICVHVVSERAEKCAVAHTNSETI